jgi:hypothetical protein
VPSVINAFRKSASKSGPHISNTKDTQSVSFQLVESLTRLGIITEIKLETNLDSRHYEELVPDKYVPQYVLPPTCKLQLHVCLQLILDYMLFVRGAFGIGFGKDSIVGIVDTIAEIS